MSDTDLCPICFQSFPIAELPEHAGSCRGGDPSQGHGGGGFKPEGGSCKGGCGFYGSDDFDGYCSACYKKKGGSPVGGGRGAGGGGSPPPAARGGGGGGGGGGAGFTGGVRPSYQPPPYKPGPLPSTIVSTKVNGLQIDVRKGDMIQERVDALVNAANKRLDHASGVAGAIRGFGGQVIQDLSDVYYHEHGELKEGDAIIAGEDVGKLNCKVLIHAVGPTWSEGRKDDVGLLSTAVMNALKVANDKGCATICIPAISSGIFGFPKGLCAKTLFAVAKQFSIENPEEARKLKTIRFTNIDEETVKHFVDAVPRNKLVASKKIQVGEVVSTISLINGDPHEETSSAYIDCANSRFDLISSFSDSQVALVQPKVRENAATLPETELQDPSKPGVFQPGTCVTISDTCGFRSVIIATCPIFDFTQPSVDALRLMMKKTLLYADARRHESIILPLLGTRGLAFPSGIAARVMVEEVHALMASGSAAHLRAVTLVEPTHVAFFREQVARISNDNGELAEAKPIELPSQLTETPPPPPNETPAQRRARERAAAEARLQAALGTEQKGLETTQASPGLS